MRLKTRELARAVRAYARRPPRATLGLPARRSNIRVRPLRTFSHAKQNPSAERTEEQVVADLAALCVSPGFVHALAMLVIRDNAMMFSGELEEDAFLNLNLPERLIRTEVTLLHGLMIKQPVDWTVPEPAVMTKYLDDADRLLRELHDCFNQAYFDAIAQASRPADASEIFGRGSVLRESMFYAGESAYIFQYLDLSIRKYEQDAQWLREHMGFDIEQAVAVAKAINQLQTHRIDDVRALTRRTPPNEWTMVPLFTFTAEEVVQASGMAREVVDAILRAFTLPASEDNANFSNLHDYNAVTASPLLMTSDGRLMLLQAYAFAEALYETPFFWMMKDKAYQPALTEHRGTFTESYVAERLASVFGSEHVFRGVKISRGADDVSDIDILVVWGDRVVVGQAKSKRLTLAAKRGNDVVIQEDFAKSVQAAYDQGITCAEAILGTGYTFKTADGKDVPFRQL